MLMCITGVMSGCGNTDEGWDIPEPATTGIEAQSGSYTFNQPGCFSVIKDVGSGQSYVYFSRDCYRYDAITINQGAFFHIHGEIGGTDCPTDAYAISGLFISPGKAEGIIKYGYDCKVTGEAFFTADHL
jgi:hypothetical protein